ncbi:MAG TPA: putative LPS assembly protein LptD [Gemmatimonadaceae bacterium]
MSLEAAESRTSVVRMGGRRYTVPIRLPPSAIRLLNAISVLLALALGTGAAHAQDPTRPPPDSLARRDSIARADSIARLDSLARADSLRRDSTRAGLDTLPKRREIIWNQADSVMAQLLLRSGYSVTRYQGNSVRLEVKEKEMYLRGKAQVARDAAILLGDTITFNDSTQIVEARGDTVLLRDPSRGPDDVVGRQLLRYDVRNREGSVREVSTAMESGERWIVHGGVAAFKGDTTQGGVSTFYARSGMFTSCQDPNPHFHFASSEIKMISKNILVARPAVMYIADIPVLWLPFIFQDVRSGRRSGIIPPRIGFSDIIRNRSGYRRMIEDFGYYFALTDYLDAQLTMDWRSGARPDEGDPGWVKFNSRFRYAWQDRFLGGELGISYHYLRDGSTNQQYSLNHRQEFSQRTKLSANLNYVTNTTVQRNTQFNPFAAVQVISSQLNFSTGRGPFSMSLGGTQQQFPGREAIDRTFPSLSITSKPITAGEWLTWTPSFNMTNTENLHIDRVGDFAYRYVTGAGGALDSIPLDRNSRSTSMRFDTPVQIFGFNWRNSFNVSDRFNDFPAKKIVVDVNDTTKKELRVYKRTYLTEVNWDTDFSLPGFFQGTWNVSPFVSIQKVDPHGLLVRSERTGNRFVSNSLRPAFGVSVAPTLYRRFPGLGPVAAIRHAISPSISFQYTPEGSVSDEYLEAIGSTRIGYLGANRQNTLSLGLNTTFEAKLRPRVDTIPEEQWQKIKLLALSFTSLGWDFERAKVTKKTGLTNRTFGVTARSDLLPGFDIGVDWSLFQGDPISDSAVFKPYREALRGTLSLGPASPIVRGLARLIGIRLSDTSASGAPGSSPSPSAPMGASPGMIAGQPIAGSISQIAGQMGVPPGRGWEWSLTYSAQRTRPPSGSGVVTVDPFADCLPFRQDLLLYESCIQRAAPTSGSEGAGLLGTGGGTYFVTPPQANAQSNLSFHITQRWAAQWSTTYDFTRKEFASQLFTLTRELHDWNATFAFMRAPNGNFTFNFHISLKAQPDIKFDWDTRDYPRGYTGIRR